MIISYFVGSNNIFADCRHRIRINGPNPLYRLFRIDRII